ncbi:MAG: phosphosulfolactate synthase [Candidatus Thermoplasmatota archaeon]|jgi:phosphosulfolactate synthase|nr:phosphosulfolactate synthase [Candidatus Thermoplasmatota archaeon]MCL5984663.1 phosphosulfolactate synthase [Candidatus Thermoplasmatota archaeon]
MTERDPPVFPSKSPERLARRDRGLTHILDRMQAPVEKEWLTLAAPYMDIVKFGWGLPLLFARETVRRRITEYHHQNLEVSTGGTLLEYAVREGRAEKMVKEAKELGFDFVEVSEGILDLSLDQVEELAGLVRAQDLDVLIEVGKKDVQRQYSLRETMERLQHARKLAPRKVILESRESGRGVGIYDLEGGIKWDWVHAIISSQPANDIIFEAPREEQQIALIMELGSEVNLGNVALDSVLPLASQRLGLRGDTFGLPVRRSTPKGSPAAKFVYYLIESHRGLEQGELVALSRLPRRTVQMAVRELERQGLITEAISLRDARRREYRCV